MPWSASRRCPRQHAPLCFRPPRETHGIIASPAPLSATVSRLDLRRSITVAARCGCRAPARSQTLLPELRDGRSPRETPRGRALASLAAHAPERAKALPGSMISTPLFDILPASFSPVTFAMRGGHDASIIAVEHASGESGHPFRNSLTACRGWDVAGGLVAPADLGLVLVFAARLGLGRASRLIKRA